MFLKNNKYEMLPYYVNSHSKTLQNEQLHPYIIYLP